MHVLEGRMLEPSAMHSHDCFVVKVHLKFGLKAAGHYIARTNRATRETKPQSQAH